MKRECTDWQLHEDVGVFILQLLQLSAELDKIREEGLFQDMEKEILDFWFQIRDFLNVVDRVDDSYVIYSNLEISSEALLRGDGESVKGMS